MNALRFAPSAVLAAAPFLAAAALLLSAPAALADETLVDFSDGLFPGGDGPVAYHGITFTNKGGGTGGPGLNGTIDWGSLFANVEGASLGLALNDQWGNTDLWMEFPEGTRTVGMLVSTGPQTLFALDFYGPGDELLGTREVQMPADGQAGIFGGQDFQLEIVRVRLYEPFGENGNISLVDDIRYSDAAVCPPDLDGNGTLDLFDFLAYVNLFNAGEDAADCTADGVLDLFDFLCFVNSFNAGC